MKENTQSHIVQPRYWCEVCSKTIPSDCLYGHNTGKKHKANLIQMQIKMQNKNEICSRGVYIYGMNTTADF